MSTTSTNTMDENVRADAAVVEQVETTETTETTEIETCRYSSKPCSNPRAVKKTGDLHSFCEFHRLMANRNQRRCEQKRRTKKQHEKAIQKRGGMMPQPFQALMGINAAPPPPASFENKYKRRRTSAHSASPTSVDSASVVVSIPSIDTRSHERLQKPKSIDPISYSSENASSLEPYAHPVPLREEDLQYLFMTVVDSTYLQPLDSSFGVDANRAFVV